MCKCKDKRYDPTIARMVGNMLAGKDGLLKSSTIPWGHATHAAPYEDRAIEIALSVVKKLSKETE